TSAEGVHPAAPGAGERWDIRLREIFGLGSGRNVRLAVLRLGFDLRERLRERFIRPLVRGRLLDVSRGLQVFGRMRILRRGGTGDEEKRESRRDRDRRFHLAASCVAAFFCSFCFWAKSFSAFFMSMPCVAR